MHRQDMPPQQAASACSEFLTPNDDIARPGGFDSWEVSLLHAKAAAWSLLCLAVMALVLWSAKP